MTMLDRMRRHKGWLKWSLGLVCLSFVWFYIPDFLSQTGDAVASNDVVARVGDRRVTAADFARKYRAQMQAYRSAYGGNMNEQLLKQLGIDQQILQQMVDEQAALGEAERLGLRATSAEVRERILAMPGLQENGGFIGEQRYRQLLSMQNPPMTPAEFEEELRQAIVLEKLRSALTDWITISDAELEREYKQRNEKVKLEVIAFPADKYRGEAAATDAEVSAQFEAHKENYRIGEKRKIKYVLIDQQAMRDKATVPPQDVERYYQDNVEQYSTPEQVRASHILLKTDGKDEAAVKKTADSLFAKIKGGADFAAVAKEHSEDEGSKVNGGDLDYFGRGRMVKEFEDKAFSMQVGEVSEPIKTVFGFHIIKVIDKKAASTRTLDEMRAQITEQLKWERAQTQATEMGDALAREITSPADLDRVAKTRSLTVKETGFFARDEPIEALGPSPDVAGRAFETEQGAVTGPIRAPQGPVFLAVTGRQDAYVPKLDEVRDRVREDVVKTKALDVAKRKAADVAAALKGAPDMEKAAKAAGLQVDKTELIARGSALPSIGLSPAIDTVAFALPVGGVSDPVAAESAVAIVKVVERQDVKPEDLASNKESLARELLAERRGRFFSAYMTKTKERLRIEIDRETLGRMIV
jgi:peptidyl-prolyl cis-trans isomerase D